MLTKLKFQNFKRFENVEIDLDDTVVLIGPNNSGKTSVLQVLSLWDIGVKHWIEKRGWKSGAKERTGVVVNRRDLFAIPVPSSRLLRYSQAVRDVSKTNGLQKTKNILMTILVEGLTDGKQWRCGFEFDYANAETFHVRPLSVDNNERMSVPEQVKNISIAYLPPMSGLSSDEFLKQPGEINVLIGQGQTAQVLRNLCFQVAYPVPDLRSPSENWKIIVNTIDDLFGVRLDTPIFSPQRAEIKVTYRERSNNKMDLSSSGRGLQQTLLLLVYLHLNPGAILLLDEPDAHLEVLRQRSTFQCIRNIASNYNAQIIAASHSEVVLNEVATSGTVIAFVGKPHRLEAGHASQVASQLVKSLTTIGWDQYYLAEQRGWVLYVEDATDLSILKEFASLLDHPARECLENCFVKYLSTNIPQQARDHFFGLQEAKSDLVGVAIFDRLDKQLQDNPSLKETMWSRREIENYFCTEGVFMRWASDVPSTDLFSLADADESAAIMQKAIEEVSRLLALDDKEPWSVDVKASEEVLDRVFRVFFKAKNLPVSFRKGRYYELIRFMKREEVSIEVVEKLDLIAETAKRARPK